ncbi:MAG: hypothetical protein J5814_04930 [Bacteroidaceae bacterium]|nr:hypothetical protein [Bacteroidaceae bacterium]
MKKILFSLTALLFGIAVQAQTSYEAVNAIDTEIDGTARYIGMGGAMNALGADISTMGVNPAGIGLYRSCDMMISFGSNNTTNKTQFDGMTNRGFYRGGSFDNVGLVISDKYSNEGVLRFVNYGFNYRKLKDFGGNTYMQGKLRGLSQTGVMAMQVYDNRNIGDDFFDSSSEYSFYNYNYYDNANYGWLSLMGSDARIIDATAFDNGYFYPSQSGDFYSNESGSSGAYDFNISANFVDQVYFGATVTYTNVNYAYNSTYNEVLLTADGTEVIGDYTLNNWYKTKGYGWGISLGTILRPIESSSLRFGLGVTLPTYLHLTDYNSAIITSHIDNDTYSMDTQSNNAYGNDCYTEYTNRTPARFNLSAGYTFESGLALDAEWEARNLATTQLFEGSGKENTIINNHTADNFGTQNTFRLGVEKMFLESFFARLGYNYTAGGFKADAWKMIPINSVQTNTDYKNFLNAHELSGGLGYRGDIFYADLAVLYSNRNYDFFPFENRDLEATALQRTNVKAVATLGFRF